MKISIVGSPGSGKTTLAAMLYSRCLLAGLNKSRLILEEAPRYIGEFGKLDTLADQIQCWKNQREEYERQESGGFSPLILDGALWLSSIYVKYSIYERIFPDYFSNSQQGMKEAAIHIKESEKYFGQSNLTIYIPFFYGITEVETGAHRIHDGNQSRVIDRYISDGLKDVTGQFVVCPEPFAQRAAFVTDLVDRIRSWMK